MSASDLRLLGCLMPGRRFSDLWYQFRPWKRLGFWSWSGWVALAWVVAGRALGQPIFLGEMAVTCTRGSPRTGFP